MNEIDQEISKNERETSPQHLAAHPPDSIMREVPSHEIERTITVSSSASTSSSGGSSSIERQATAVSRVSTQRDIERHPTMLSRIQTARSQHTGTTGGGLQTRTRDSKRPLPEFGGGKPYPPPLPEREAYVVEFDGPDDPLHAQNWPLKKK